MEKKMTNRQKQALETKKRIYTKTKELMATREFSTLTVSEICKNAEVSIGSFYHYFQSKEDVLTMIYSFEENFENLPQDLSPIESILYLFRRELQIIEEYGSDLLSQFLKMQILKYNEHVVEADSPFYKKLDTLVLDGIRCGELYQDNDHTEIVEALLRIYRGSFFDWVIYNGNYPLKEKAIYDLSYFLKTLKVNTYRNLH